jgi:TonB-dependent SusC/RagA subfamily outer membrane receptor
MTAGVSSITEEQLDQYPTASWGSVLSRIPGVEISGGGMMEESVLIRGGVISLGGTSTEPLLVLDGMPVPTTGSVISFLESNVRLHEVTRIDVLKDGSAAVYGSRGAGGVISVFRKEYRTSLEDATQPSHIKTISPLGFQPPFEFYAPKYDTPEKLNSRTPDLRTTIHWQPVIQTDSQGVATFEFYTADDPSSYTVIIEGLTDNGKIIRKEEELFR